MEKSSLSVSDTSSSVEFVARNVWNATMLLFHVQISGIFEPFMEEANLARIALSFHFESLFWYGIIAFLHPSGFIKETDTLDTVMLHTICK